MAVAPDISEFAAFAALELAQKLKVEQEQISWHGQLPDVPLYVVMCDHAEPGQPTSYGTIIYKTWEDVAVNQIYSIAYGDETTVMYLTGQCPHCNRVHFGQVKQFHH